MNINHVINWKSNAIVGSKDASIFYKWRHDEYWKNIDPSSLMFSTVDYGWKRSKMRRKGKHHSCYPSQKNQP